jgi:hypothetical protein
VPFDEVVFAEMRVYMFKFSCVLAVSLNVLVVLLFQGIELAVVTDCTNKAGNAGTGNR